MSDRRHGNTIAQSANYCKQSAAARHVISERCRNDDNFVTGRRPSRTDSLAPPWTANSLERPAPLARRRSSRSSSSTPRTMVRRDARLARRQDYPNLNTLFLLAGRAPTTTSPTRITRRPARRLRPDARRQPRVRRGGQRGAPQLVEGDNGFFCFCHDDVALDPDAVRVLVEELYRSNAGIVGPEAGDVGRPRRAPARRPRRRPLRRARPDRIEPARVRPGAARRRHATCSPSRRPACSCAPTCSAPSAASTRRSPSTATTSTCAGGPTSAGRGVVVAPSARVRHREELEAAGPTSTTTSLRARHRMRSVATLTAGPRLPLRSLELVAADHRRARRRPVHRPLRRGVGVRARLRRADPAHPDAARPARRDRQAAPASATPRCTTCKRAAAPGSRRSAGPATRRWSSASTRGGADDDGGHRSHPPLARALARPGDHLGRGRRRRPRRQPHVHQPVGADDRRVPPVPGQPARSVGATSSAGGTAGARRDVAEPDRVGRAGRSAACCGCSTWASASP